MYFEVGLIIFYKLIAFVVFGKFGRLACVVVGATVPITTSVSQCENKASTAETLKHIKTSVGNIENYLGAKKSFPPNVDVIVGSQWGDEGKGKLVDIVSADYDICARVAGGSNAGHTIVVGVSLLTVMKIHFSSKLMCFPPFVISRPQNTNFI